MSPPTPEPPDVPGTLVIATCVAVLAECRPLGELSLGLSRVGGQALGALLYASDERAANLENQQLVLGEGPARSAILSRGPVIVPDLLTSESVWPMFVFFCSTEHVRSVMSFPVQIGAVFLAVLTLSGAEQISLDQGPLEAVLRATDALAIALLHRDLTEPVSAADHGSVLLNQAAGIAMVQMKCTLADAMVGLRAHAFATGRPLQDIAADVVERRLRLSHRVTSRWR